jgi:CBS domain-containing protein
MRRRWTVDARTEGNTRLRSQRIIGTLAPMQVSSGMSTSVVTVNPGVSLHDAARSMAERKVGAAVVIDPEQPGPGIITERDVLQAVGQGQDPHTELVRDHLSAQITFASPDWSLERAAEAMVRGGFRHLVVVDGGELVGVLSMRDIVRCWVQDGATSELPSDVPESA